MYVAIPQELCETDISLGNPYHIIPQYHYTSTFTYHCTNYTVYTQQRVREACKS